MLCLPYYAYIFSSTKLEQVLPGAEEGRGDRVERGSGGEMTQTTYAHVNK
jgi:hypothetical protein